jgi:phenylacetate-CoA ligase
MNSLLAKQVIYPLIQVLRNERVYPHLRQVEQSQWLSGEELRSLQVAQLRNLFSHAKEYVPYYRKVFKDNGMDWREITGIDDVKSIPFLAKKTYQSNIAEFISEQNRGKIDIRNTSGSSGIPLAVRKPREVFSRMRAVMYRYYRWYGIDIGSRQGRILGHPLTLKALLQEKVQDLLLNKVRLDPAALSRKRVFRYLKGICDKPLDYLYGYPSAMVAISDYAREAAFDLKDLGIPVIICTGENLYEWQRCRLQDDFGSKVVNEYGSSEFGIIAFECPEGNLHLSSDNLLVELVKSPDHFEDDIDDVAEIVITDLFNFGVPLIRYRTGDLAVPSAEQDCACGRSLPIISRIEGRVSEMVKVPGGRIVHSEFFHYLGDALNEMNCGVRHFKVLQLDEQSYEMQIVPDYHFSEESGQKVIQLIRKRLGQETNVRVRVVPEIPRDNSGKLRYFVPMSGLPKSENLFFSAPQKGYFQ